MTVDVAATSTVEPGLRRLRVAALASVIANVGIILTGGAVRLTGSGLGCPTWPTCTRHSLVPTDELGIHSAVEFTNRTLTFVLTVVAITTLVLAYRAGREKALAWVAFAGIPAQALLGGNTVLTGLNPWTVAIHLLVSIAIVTITFALWWRVSDHDLPRVPKPVRTATDVLAGFALLVLALGTVVTGSGPHAGDRKTPRMGFDIRDVTQLHADAVMLLIGLTVGLALLALASGGSAALVRAVRDLLVVELAQGLIGYVQYFTGVPSTLVEFHLLGAALVWIAVLRAHFSAHANKTSRT